MLNDKVAIVTGAARGLGLAMAQHLGAQAALFLASDAPSYVTGAVLDVNGGFFTS